MSRLSRHLLPALLLAFPLAVLPAQQPAPVGEPTVAPELSVPAEQATPDAAIQGGPRLANARVGVDIAHEAAVLGDRIGAEGHRH